MPAATPTTVESASAAEAAASNCMAAYSASAESASMYAAKAVAAAVAVAPTVESTTIDEAAAIQVIRGVETKAKRAEEWIPSARQPVIGVQGRVPVPARIEGAAITGILRGQIHVSLAQVL